MLFYFFITINKNFTKKKTLKTFNNKTELVTSSYSTFCYKINKMADRTEITRTKKYCNIQHREYNKNYL